MVDVFLHYKKVHDHLPGGGLLAGPDRNREAQRGPEANTDGTFRMLRVVCQSSHSRRNPGGLLRGDTTEVEGQRPRVCEAWVSGSEKSSKPTHVYIRHTTRLALNTEPLAGEQDGI